ncbi:uncharacterized protein PG986_005119 [Apiospora aurea]|uniref:Uncharacterized protein n=1 Tax=Apiospora aurea TaxID=335848 RepID=A0ABR1QGM2_9PEZI
MVKTYTQKRPYFLLDEPCPVDGETLGRLLGLVVQNPADPIGAEAKYAPDKGLAPQEAIDDLYPEREVRCTDIEIIRRGLHDTYAKLVFSKAVKAWGNVSKQRDTAINAPVFRRVSIENGVKRLTDLLEKEAPPSAADSTVAADAGGWYACVKACITWIWLSFHALLGFPPLGLQPEGEPKLDQRAKRAEYQKQVLELLREQPGKSPHLAVINSTIVCSDYMRATSKVGKNDMGAGLGTGHYGAAHGVDLNAAAERSRLNEAAYKGAYEGDYLIACSYLPVVPRQGTTRQWFSSSKMAVENREMWTLQLGDKPLRKGNLERTFGPGVKRATSAHGDMEKANEEIIDDSDDFGAVLMAFKDESGLDSSESE